MSPNDESYDPLAEILSNDDAVSAALRERVLGQTLGVVRGRRRLRQVRNVSLWIGCFAAGMLTMHWVSAGPEVASPVVKQTARATPAVAQKAAPKTRHNAYEVQRRQGDRELSDPRRMESAVYRYSRALALASNEQRAIDPEKDSWLLMALKLDHNRDKEQRHARD
ncbi:MAG: hypothetical protein JNM18_08770 [Planctomycetaceae bacterium]|nr:hypothetical protein [Planctomycetaceae bacterium]